MSEDLIDWRIPEGKQINALILVAHTDDETIFSGGLLLTYPFWNWTVISMTLQTEKPERLEEFLTAMNVFKEFGVNIENAYSLKKAESGNPWDKLTELQIIDWTESVKSLNLTPDVVFTHNSQGGEYGNFLHMETSKVAQSVFENVWEFVYPGTTTVCDKKQPTKAKINELNLSKEILAKKSEAFEKAYAEQAPGLWKDLGDLMDYEFNKGPEIYTSV